MFEIMDFLQGNANPEQMRLAQIEKEEKERKEKEKFLEELYQKNLENQQTFLKSQDVREKQLRELPDTKARLGQETSDLWKERFGFSPVGKKGVGGFFQKLGAGLLEGGNRLNKDYTPIGEEAYKRAQKSYKDEYDKLLGVERLESQQYMNQGKLQQEMMNNIQRQGLGQKKLDLQKEQTDVMSKLKTRQMDEQAKVAKGKQEVSEFNAYLNSLKTEAQVGNLEAKTEYQKMVNHVSKEMGIPPALVNDNTMSMYFAKQKDKEYQDETLKNLGLIKKQGKQDGGLKPQLKQTGKKYYIDENGNPQEKSVFEVIDPNNLETQETKSQAALTPEQIKAAHAANAARGIPPGTTKIGGNYLAGMDSKTGLQTIRNNPLGPQRDFGSGDAAKKNLADYEKGKEMWRQLATRSTQIAQNFYDGVATGRSEDWKDPLKQTSLGIAIRAATGRYGADEATVKQSEVFNLMEHIKARFGSRPAYALFDKIAKTMDHDYATEETYAKQSGTMHLLVTLAQTMAEDERYVEELDKINEELEKNKENRIAFGVAFADEVNAAYQMAKAGNRNYVPNIDRVFDMATTEIQRDKNKKRNLR